MDSNTAYGPMDNDPGVHAIAGSRQPFDPHDPPFLNPPVKNLRQVSNFSNTSSNYSNQTHQSSASQASHQSAASHQSLASHQSSSSVIHNSPENRSNVKSNVKSNVLDYIQSNGSDFDPDDLFKQRQSHSFITSFDRIPTKNQTNDQRQKLHQEDEEDDHEREDDEDYDEDEDDDIDDEDIESPVHMGQANTVQYQSSPVSKKSGSIFFDDDYEHQNDNEFEYEDEDDEDMPSPPRSPPKEIDPDKLYGLYDFSGPDPSHCSLARDEPVYLINDQDNYWWLIRKLSKQERIRLTKERILNKSDSELDDIDEDYMLTDEEDGKIGFVPAECLETYGERLARLNCFKNEELEKSSKDLLVSNPSSCDNINSDNLNSDNVNSDNVNSDNVNSSDNLHENIISKSVSSIGLGSPVNFQKSPDTTLSRSGSILKDGTKQSINKSVTFEDLGVLELNEESEDEENEFPSHYNIPEIDEIHNEIHKSKADDEERKSEILSDIYPTESPLIINKRKSTSDSPSPTKDSSFGKDSNENVSLESFSPNTPQSSYQTPLGTTQEVFNNSDEEYKTPVEKVLPKVPEKDTPRYVKRDIIDLSERSERSDIRDVSDRSYRSERSDTKEPIIDTKEALDDSHPPKVPEKDSPKVPEKDSPSVPAKDSPKVPEKDVSRDSSRDFSRYVPNDNFDGFREDFNISKEDFTHKDISASSSNDFSNDFLKDFSKDTSKDLPQNPSQSNSQNNSHDFAQDVTPKIGHATNDDITSQGDFSTPKLNSSKEYDYFHDYTNEYYNDGEEELEKSESFRNLTPKSKMLRRSELLMKLNQVTSDIQNELQDYDSDEYGQSFSKEYGQEDFKEYEFEEHEDFEEHEQDFKEREFEEHDQNFKEHEQDLEEHEQDFEDHEQDFRDHEQDFRDHEQDFSKGYRPDDFAKEYQQNDFAKEFQHEYGNSFDDKDYQKDYEKVYKNYNEDYDQEYKDYLPIKSGFGSTSSGKLDIVSIHSSNSNVPEPYTEPERYYHSHDENYEVGSGYGDILDQGTNDSKPDNVTPLTSVNSFVNSKSFEPLPATSYQPSASNVVQPTGSNFSGSNLSHSAVTSASTLSSNSTPVADKRKSKPVHDMFVPILGKFDELAEKLAEIDEML